MSRAPSVKCQGWLLPLFLRGAGPGLRGDEDWHQRVTRCKPEDMQGVPARLSYARTPHTGSALNEDSMGPEGHGARPTHSHLCDGAGLLGAARQRARGILVQLCKGVNKHEATPATQQRNMLPRGKPGWPPPLLSNSLKGRGSTCVWREELVLWEV